MENLKLTPFTVGHHCKFHLFVSPVEDTFFHLLYMERQLSKKIKTLPSPLEIVFQQKTLDLDMLEYISHVYDTRLLWYSYITASYKNLFALMRTIFYSSVPYVLPEDCIQTHLQIHVLSSDTSLKK